MDPDDDLRAWIRERAARKGYSTITTVDPGDEVVEVPGPIDVVVTVNAFHHLPDERAAYLGGLAQVLGPEGRVAVIEPLPRWHLFGHATPPEEIRSVMATAGFGLVEEHDFLPNQSFTVFAPAPVQDGA